MNEQEHFKRFKRSHRESMALAQIERSRTTKPDGNGSSSAAVVLQEALQLPKPVSFWDRYFKWEHNLTVAGRTIEKGWVIPQQLGVALIVLLLSGVGALYWTMDARIDAKDNAYQEQRDMLIEIKTELKIRKEHDNERFQKLENEFQSVHAWQQVTNRELVKLQKE